MKKMHENLIEQLLLCDPVTERGREKLYDLDLIEDITPENFFSGENCFWVSPSDLTLLPIDEEILYDPTPDNQRSKDVIMRRKNFDARFSPKTNRKGDREAKKREFTLLMGVVGAGKSLELQRQIFTHYHAIPYSFFSSRFQREHGKTMCENVVYVDMERVNTEIPKGTRGYSCNDTSDVLWLFFTKLLATLIYYIEFLYVNYHDTFKQIGQTLNMYFNRKTRGNETSSIKKYMKFVEVLNNYANDNTALIDDVFDSIIETIVSEVRLEEYPLMGEHLKPAIKSIGSVLHLLGFVMFGAAPDKNKCIIVDNIEDLIKVDNIKLIDISLDDAKEIYNALLRYSENIKDIYDDAGVEGSFHIVMALRRTTWDNLQVRFAGNHNSLLDDIFDITGDITLTGLWKTKGYPIWNKYLKNKYDEQACEFIDAVNHLICCDNNWRNDISQRYARILSHGLRRQGHSISKALFNMFYNQRFGVFSDQIKYINMKDFKSIFSEDNHPISMEARYLCKSATVEYYLMNQFTSTGVDADERVGARWRNLSIGRIEGGMDRIKEDYYYDFSGERRRDGSRFHFTKYSYQFYDDKKYYNLSGALLRQLLMILSTAPESPRASKCAAPLYETVSLHTIIDKALSKESSSTIEDLDYLELSRIILAGAQPDVEAEFSPLFLIQNGVDYKDVDSYSDKLKNIWEASPSDSKDGDHPYCRQKCGIRITESGADFLFNIQPSYEFFSALFCYDFPPLLFIKSVEEIAHVIGCVYNSANKACGSNDKPEHLAFRDNVKKLHTQYLKHYRDYIKNMGVVIGFTIEQQSELINGINSVIQKYSNWKVS